MAESKAELLLDHDYFKKKVYDQCLLYYADAKAALLTQIEEKERTHPLSGSQLANLSIGGQTSARRHLLEITLPQFSGDFLTWRPFHDLFSSLVGRNADISNVEKMHYLRTSLISRLGEAAQLISNLPMSEDSFASAWDLLISRFENKRLLISVQVDRLFRTKTISQRSAKDLNTLLNTTTEALNALKSLGAPVQHWDHLLVHLTVQRLDPSTREAWEVKLGSTTDPPSYKDIRTFLTGRARAMESMEFGTSSCSPADKPTRTFAHFSLGAPDPWRVWSSEPRAPLQRTNQLPRLLRQTSKTDMSAHLRRNIVIDKRLCFNCLGRHNAVACQNSKRCRECGNKHHTMIHMDSQSPPRSSTTLGKATPSTAATQTSAPASPSKSTTSTASE
ncbi:uncharacterized protein LOC115245422 [Formica exsecta]|uniref:uncharacterized protein LOC115245422 n=1 Tax=Formica exsecta TaxID=72781 RepID=UPI0011412BFE|nr:uncharacterized protein LOC115245422 [Formica exsecta]